MDKESQTCGSCSIAYHTTDRIPRILNCAHTLCSICLNKIINTPDLRKCPFDGFAFNKKQKSLENFPPNFALLTLLDGKRHNKCQVHGSRLTEFCFQDKVKICSDCALFGEHKGHSVKKIKDMKAKAAKVKTDLHESVVSFEKNEFEKNQDMEKLKNRCMGQLGNKFGEINKILREKQLEWRKQMETLFSERKGNELLLKEEASKAIEEIDQACKNEEYLTVLDQDFNSVISRLQHQVAKDEVTRISEQTSRMIGSLESFLTNQGKSLKNFDWLDVLDEKEKAEEPIIEEEIPEQKRQEEHQQLSPEKFIESQPKSAIIKAKTVLDLVKNVDLIYIGISRCSIPTEVTLDFGEFQKMERIEIEFDRYDSLFQDPDSLTFLSEFLQELQNNTSLSVVLHPPGLTDNRARDLLNHIFCRIQFLTQIEVDLETCEISNQVLLDFFTDVLPKANSLKSLTLKLGSTLIIDQSLSVLAGSLSPFSQNLKSFTLGVGYTAITDDGIQQIFHVIEGVEALALELVSTGITDVGLKVLGENVMPCMKNLKSFALDAGNTRITIEGVNAIFTGIPMDIRYLDLDFRQVTLSDEVVSLVEEKVCPKLQLVEKAQILVEGKELQDKVSKVKNVVVKEAKKNRRAVKENKEKNDS